jgi:excisionase family DNA binding protein
VVDGDTSTHHWGCVNGQENPTVTIERPLTVEEAADALGLSRAHLYALIKRGQFPVVKFGRLTRIAPDALRAFIAAGGTTPHQSRPAPADDAR